MREKTCILFSLCSELFFVVCVGLVVKHIRRISFWWTVPPPSDCPRTIVAHVMGFRYRGGDSVRASGRNSERSPRVNEPTSESGKHSIPFVGFTQLDAAFYRERPSVCSSHSLYAHCCFHAARPFHVCEHVAQAHEGWTSCTHQKRLHTGITRTFSPNVTGPESAPGETNRRHAASVTPDG